MAANNTRRDVVQHIIADRLTIALGQANGSQYGSQTSQVSAVEVGSNNGLGFLPFRDFDGLMLLSTAVDEQSQEVDEYRRKPAFGLGWRCCHRLLIMAVAQFLRFTCGRCEESGIDGLTIATRCNRRLLMKFFLIRVGEDKTAPTSNE